MIRRGGRLGAMFLALVLAVGAVVAPAAPRGEARIVLDEGGELMAAPPTEVPGDPEELARWIDTQVLPIPQQPQPPLSSIRAQGASGWALFRAPFPPVPVWDPPGIRRVGLQAGHWQYDQAPDELAELRSNPGTSGGGKAEWEVTLDVARRAAARLEEAGVMVDLLPAAVPIRYRAHAFVSIHADGDNSGVLNGFKVGRSGFSSIPEVDDALVESLNGAYAESTGLARHDEQVSLRMRWYYAFNARRYQHAVAPGVPQVIIETGFLTSYSDRQLLIGDPDRVARGIAEGVLRFLRRNDGGGG